nr:hypothetical protein [Tanacetum cinerariifolium]
MIFDEFRRLSSMEDDLFAYKLGILEDFSFQCVEQPYYNLKNGNLHIYEPRQCYDEYEIMFTKAVILIDDRSVKLIDMTLEQWLDLKFGDHKKVDKEIVEGVVVTWLIQSYRKKFEEYIEIKRRLEVNGINTDVECEEYLWEKKEDEESREDAWSNYLPNDDNGAIQANQERFDDHELMEDDDDDTGT